MGEFDTKRNGIPVKILETGEEFNSIRKNIMLFGTTIPETE